MVGFVSAHISPQAGWFKRRYLCCLLCLCLAELNSAQGNQANAEIELLAELRVSATEGGKGYQFVPAKKVEQGQEIYYTLRIRNPDAAVLSEVFVIQPLPANTHYVAGSASGAGADIEFSVDGGARFAKPTQLKNPNDVQRVADPVQYTHIRWQLRYPLAPRAVVLARFRAVFN